jgi:DNA-binding transcriptional LysR family regulator
LSFNRAAQHLSIYTLPPCLKQFRQAYPKVRLEIDSCSLTIQQELRSGIIDLAFLRTNGCPPHYKSSWNSSAKASPQYCQGRRVKKMAKNSPDPQVHHECIPRMVPQCKVFSRIITIFHPLAILLCNNGLMEIRAQGRV